MEPLAQEVSREGHPLVETASRPVYNQHRRLLSHSGHFDRLAGGQHHTASLFVPFGHVDRGRARSYSSPLKYHATMPRLATATTPKTTAMPGAAVWA